jgi:hypothetical protein
MFASQRRAILENLVEVYAKRPHAAEAVAFAKRELGRSDKPQSSPSQGGVVPDPASSGPPETN